ncbi:hypothetical protein SETIT_2G337200v2 [Setaria italica]|uniref:Fungal lipase-like domain-containing protein n=1 Tax=Setaria italica TaxID=4555 RepID=K3ZUG5_SETIT|nr:GDSL esterase/lipase At4g10955 [Setaria italica]RCV13327.1 hypothetical protein SETIT_2G337200v2 [Setaria italica]
MGLSDDKNKFDVYGPKHMMAQTGIEFDWDDKDHCRCIIACLVKGTYVLECDRTKKVEDKPDALAPAWWESFHFQRHNVLEFNCECVFCTNSRRIFEGRGYVYGAVFEYAPPEGARRHPSAPSYVVAFRGTMPRDPTIAPDMLQNLCILINKQHVCHRFLHAREKVGQLLSSISIPNNGGSSVVWLAGHSLGASIALDVGRHMMTNRDLNLPAFLFNPPHVSLAPAIGEAAKKDVYTVGYLGRYALGKVLTPHKDRMDELFQKLKPWKPNLYAHERDIISKGFIDYFEQREVMKDRLPGMARTAATLSFRDMAYQLFGKHEERPHLLPSALLWKNQSKDGNAHELRQWWQSPEGPKKLVLIHNLYTWP